MRLLICVCICFFITSSFASEQKDKDLEQASIYQQTGDYRKAIEIYTRFLEGNYASAPLHYNLGLCYYKDNQVGKAILHLEKALKYDPNMDIASENIETIQAEQPYTVFQVEPFFISKFWRVFSNQMPLPIWTILGLIMLLVSLYSLYRYLFDADSKISEYAKFGLIASLVVSILFFMAANTRYNSIYRSDYAVTIQEVKRYMGPSEKSASTEDMIPEGTKIKVLEELEGWYKVSLPDLDQVWMTPGMFEII